MIYFFQAGGNKGPIKIGFASKNVDHRLRTCRTYCPDHVEMICCVDDSPIDERAIHNKFRHIRIRGEWFFGAQDLLSFIEQCRIGEIVFSAFIPAPKNDLELAELIRLGSTSAKFRANDSSFRPMV